MKKTIQIEVRSPKSRNYEKIISDELKGNFRGRRFEYAYTSELDGQLVMVFSSQKMKIRNAIKQFDSKNLKRQKHEFLMQKTFYGGSSVWRLVWEYKLPNQDKTLCLFEKTLDN